MIYGNKITLKLIKNNNQIDKVALIAQLEKEVDQYEASKKLEESIIAEAVDEVFNASKSNFMDLNMLKILATNTSKLQTISLNHNIVINKIYNYLKKNSQGKNIGTENKKVWENPKSLFIIMNQGKKIMISRRKS